MAQEKEWQEGMPTHENIIFSRLRDCSALNKPEFAEDKEALVRLLGTVGLEDASK